MLHEANPLLVLSIVLAAGVACGTLAKRFHLPSVTGQILIGIILGPSLLNIFEPEALEGLHPVTHFALGLIAVTVGSHLNWFRLRNAFKRLSWLILLEATLTPLLVILAVIFLTKDRSWYLGALLAAMAVSTAPATIIALVKESHSKGIFVKTLVAAVALNNMACLGLFEAARAAVQVALDTTTEHSTMDAVIAPFQQIFFAALLGGAAGLLLIVLTRKVMRRDRLATASIISILFTSGLADFWGVSSLLACMFLGMTLANVTPDKDETGHHVFADFQGAIFAIFFTLAGLELDLGYLIGGGGLIAIAVVAMRIIGKVGSARIAMRIAGATKGVRENLGYALVPQAGVAVGLIFLVREEPALASLHEPILAIGLTVVTLNEIIGPILTRFALSRSGDFGKDRARLIDFLHEENIVTDLHAETKEDAIRELAELLIQSNHLKDDRQRLMQSILDREKDVSTCVGGGLAVPHGVLEEGDAIVGAMGISQKGLNFDTPDGRPVHCMVVLATPPTKRDQHLEVLAALARAIGTDPVVQHALFNVDTPGHAYEILHAEESEDFNYFLEDD